MLAFFRTSPGKNGEENALMTLNGVVWHNYFVSKILDYDVVPEAGGAVWKFPCSQGVLGRAVNQDLPKEYGGNSVEGDGHGDGKRQAADALVDDPGSIVDARFPGVLPNQINGASQIVLSGDATRRKDDHPFLEFHSRKGPQICLVSAAASSGNVKPFVVVEANDIVWA